MFEAPISAEEFEKRLSALALSGVQFNLPRKQRDRHILFRSAAQALDADHQYSEPDLNAELALWLQGIGIGIDHVTLRRHLVDEGYLIRERDGSTYVTSLEGGRAYEFESSVATVDSYAVVNNARLSAAQRKSTALVYGLKSISSEHRLKRSPRSR
jgi:hypothetical protein